MTIMKTLCMWRANDLRVGTVHLEVVLEFVDLGSLLFANKLEGIGLGMGYNFVASLIQGTFDFETPGNHLGSLSVLNINQVREIPSWKDTPSRAHK
jgi:hypothetical protein